MLEIAKNANKKHEILTTILFYFFSIFKKFIKSSNNIPTISKTIKHTPMTWCTHLHSYSAKTKREGQTDGQTDRRGALQYLLSRAFGAAGDKNQSEQRNYVTNNVNI